MGSGRTDQGYLGLEKMETLLCLHRGLEKLSLCGIEADISPRAIEAQGSTLTHLTIRVSKPSRKGGNCMSSRLPLFTLEEIIRMCAALPKLQVLDTEMTCDEEFNVSEDFEAE